MESKVTGLRSEPKVGDGTGFAPTWPLYPCYTHFIEGQVEVWRVEVPTLTPALGHTLPGQCVHQEFTAHPSPEPGDPRPSHLALFLLQLDLDLSELGPQVLVGSLQGGEDLRLVPLAPAACALLGHGEGGPRGSRASGPIACLWLLYIFSLT